MSREYSPNGQRPKVKTLSAVVVLVSNAFTWYFATYFLMAGFIDGLHLNYLETIAIWTIDSGGAALAALLVASQTNRLRNRERFLILWMVLGIVSSIVPLFMVTTSFLGLVLIASLWGVSFGLGMPLSMEYYAGNSTLKNRGRTGGAALLVSYLGIFGFGFIRNYDLSTFVLSLAVWRAIGLVFFYILKNKRTAQPKMTGTTSYASILKERSFILYFIPWFLFSLINYLNMPILRNLFGIEFADWSSLIEGVILGVVAVIGGFMCDSIGRKRIIVSGFVTIGLGYALLSVFPYSTVSWYFYTIADGVAWGMFGVAFLMVLWGDLAYEKPSRKYYALGGLPFLFANLLQVLIGDNLVESISVYTVFPLTSLFLFLAVLPLIYAPETLPEKELKERELRQYIDKAKKAKGKYA